MSDPRGDFNFRQENQTERLIAYRDLGDGDQAPC
jgi:hypothetical protein